MNKKCERFTFQINKHVNVIVYPRPDAYSAAVSFWLLRGGVNETRKEAGIAHVLEHMMFKSNEQYTTKQIGEEFTRLGAVFNASTDWDMTNYRATVPYMNLADVIILYAKMLKYPLFNEEELETEKGAIIQEINMYKNRYDSLSEDCAIQGLYGNTDDKKNRFNDFLIGTEKSVNGVTSEDLHKRHSKRCPLTISIVGRVPELDSLFRLLYDLFHDWNVKKRDTIDIPSYQWDVTRHINRDIDQDHITEVHNMSDIKWGTRECTVMGVLNRVYGGTESSRLFTEIREKRGLAYAVFSRRLNYEFATHLEMYIGTTKNKAWDALKLVRDIQHKLMNTKVPAKELDKVKEGMIGHNFIGFDDFETASKCIGSRYLASGTEADPYEFEERVRSITADEVRDMAVKVFTCKSNCTAIVGPGNKLSEIMPVKSKSTKNNDKVHS